MGVILNRKERFATEGIRFQRHNGDGTIPTPLRFLGGGGPFDLSSLAGGEGDITLKVDSAAPVTVTADFSGAAVLSSVTKEEALDALNSAFSSAGVNFTTDAKTGRIMGTKAGSPGKVIQFTGEPARLLDFGQSLQFGGNGLQIISFFDDETISIGLPKDVKDKEEIDIEGAKGTITRMIIGSMLQGLSPVVTLKQKDYPLLELIQGGKLDRENGTYDPPLSHESDHPTFWAEVYSPIYNSGSNKLSDVAGFECILLRSMIGTEGDVPIEAKAWATYAFNLSATEYQDENGNEFPAYQEATLSKVEFEALDLKNTNLE